MKIHVRLAKPSDKQPVLDFTRNTWENGDYIHLVWDIWLNDKRGALYVADLNGEPVGILRARYLPDNSVWLEGLRVHPNHRRKGIAQILNREVIKKSIEKGYRVFRGAIFEWNKPSMNLADKLGFKILKPKWIIHKIELENNGNVLNYELLEPEKFAALVEKTREYKERNGLVFAGWAWFKLNSESSRRMRDYFDNVRLIRVENVLYMLRLRKEPEPRIEVNHFNLSESNLLKSINKELLREVFPETAIDKAVLMVPIVETESHAHFTNSSEIERLFIFEGKF